MSEDKSILARLEAIARRRVADLADADVAAEAARLRRDLLRLTAEIDDFLARASGKRARAAAEEAPAYVAAGSLAGLTLHEAARRVLRSVGAPMHVRELGARIKAGGWRHPRSTRARPDQIEYQLAARLARRPDEFRKTAPNTFGLAEWPDIPTPRRKPRLGLFASGEPGLAQKIADEPGMMFEDEDYWR